MSHNSVLLAIFVVMIAIFIVLMFGGRMEDKPEHTNIAEIAAASSH